MVIHKTDFLRVVPSTANASPFAVEKPKPPKEGSSGFSNVLGLKGVEKPADAKKQPSAKDVLSSLEEAFRPSDFDVYGPFAGPIREASHQIDMAALGTLDPSSKSAPKKG